MTRCINCRPAGTAPEVCETCRSEGWKPFTSKDIPPEVMRELERRRKNISVKDAHGNIWNDFTDADYNEYSKNGIPLKRYDETTKTWVPNEAWEKIVYWE